MAAFFKASVAEFLNVEPAELMLALTSGTAGIGFEVFNPRRKGNGVMLCGWPGRPGPPGQPTAWAAPWAHQQQLS